MLALLVIAKQFGDYPPTPTSTSTGTSCSYDRDVGVVVVGGAKSARICHEKWIKRLLRNCGKRRGRGTGRLLVSLKRIQVHDAKILERFIYFLVEQKKKQSKSKSKSKNQNDNHNENNKHENGNNMKVKGHWKGCCNGFWDIVACIEKNEDKRDRRAVVLEFVLAKDNEGFQLSHGAKKWSLKILQTLNTHVALVTANAYISTLGGGHFLCKQIDDAERMAFNQLKVAKRLGDNVLASQCRIHLAYNQIQRGNLKTSKYLLLYEWVAAHLLHSSLLKAMVRAAWLYRRRLKSISHILEKGHAVPTEDEFHRQRFLLESKKKE